MTPLHSTFAWKQLSTRMRLELPPICHLCGGSIDRGLKSTHRDSWTLDHVLPYANYPDLALEPSNLAPAHRRCNSSKAAGREKREKNSRDW